MQNPWHRAYASTGEVTVTLALLRCRNQSSWVVQILCHKGLNERRKEKVLEVFLFSIPFHDCSQKIYQGQFCAPDTGASTRATAAGWGDS